MRDEHSTLEDFEQFLRKPTGPGSSSRNTRLVRHLLATCPPCRENLAQAVSKPKPEPEYGEAFARAQQSLAAFFETGEAAAAPPEELLEELQPLPAAAQIERVRSDRRYAHPSFVKHLIDASHAVRYQDPAGMLHRAALARAAAEACSTETVGSELKQADLLAQAWRQYGNALRVLGRIREAEEALGNAYRHLGQGTGDPLLRALYFTQMASLRMFQRRFSDAIDLTEEAGQIYRSLDDDHELAGTLVQRAIARLYAGEAEDAVQILNRAIPLIDAERDSQLLLIASHNLVRCYIDLGRPEQALSIYFETRDLYKRFQEPLIRLRVSWHEGQLLRDLGHLRTAEKVLLQARQGFSERELFYEAALISLDLAAVYVKLQAEPQLQRTIAETVPIFRSLGVDREALAMLLQLQQLTHQSRKALELLGLLSSRIEKLPRWQSLV